MTVTINNIQHESPVRIDPKAGNATAVRKVIIDGDQLVNLKTDIFGGVTVPGWGYTISKRAAHPVYSWLSATHMEAEPHPREHQPESSDRGDTAPGTGGLYYRELAVTIHYEGYLLNFNTDPNDPTPPNGTYLSHDRQMGAVTLMHDTEEMTWEKDGHPVENVQAFVVIPVRTHTLTWYGVSSPPWTAIEESTGHVNESEQYGWKAETCQFMGAEHNATYNADGDTQYTLRYTFQERVYKPDSAKIYPTGGVVTLQHFFKDGDNVPWQRLLVNGQAGEYQYDTADFASLFQTGP